MQNNREITIPFTGFYESFHSSIIERDFNMNFQSDSASGGDELDLIPEDLQDELWVNTSYREAYKQYAEQYAEEFEDYISEKIKEVCGVDISIKFKELISPREYNFTTDRIFCDISDIDCGVMFEGMQRNKEIKERFKQLIEKRFTSCDGFISFYSNDLDDWLQKDIKDYDHNELATLLEAYIPEDESLNASEYYDRFDSDIMETIQGNPSFDVLSGVPEKFLQYTYHAIEEQKAKQPRLL